MKKKIVGILVLFLVVSFGFAGYKILFAGAETSERKPAVVIRFAHWRVEDIDVFNKIIKKFEEEHPGIYVIQSVDDTNEYRKSLPESMKNGTGPDIFANSPGGDFAGVVEMGGYMDLTGIKLLGQINAELLKPGQYKDKQYAVPYQLVYNIPVYNKEIFAKNNLQPPTDWNGFLSVCETLKNSGVIPLIFDSEIGYSQFMNPMLMNNMPEADTLQKVQKGEAKLTDAWFVTTLSQFKELKDRGFMEPDIEGTKKAGAAALFSQEKGAMLAQGSYQMVPIKQQNPSIKQGLLAPITVSQEQKKYDGIHTATFLIGLNAKSQYVAAAQAFMEYLFSPEVAALYANTTGQLVTLNGVQYQLPELAEQSTWLSRKTLFQPRFTITNPEVEKAIANAIKDVLTGAAPQAAAAKAQQAVDAAIKK